MLERFIYGGISGLGITLIFLLLRKLYHKIDSKKNGCLIFVVGFVAIVFIILILLIIFAITSGN